MANASDKARFYLEQSVPDLHDLERKKIFTNDEIRAIARKRSDFEHQLNSPRATPAEWARYLAYELNLRSLLRKRAKRVGITEARPKAKSTAAADPSTDKNVFHASQRRLFALFERATRRFHGNVGLWQQYLGFCQLQRAHARMERVLTSALRILPACAELWRYAAYWEMETRGDSRAARDYMTRGLRFCREDREMWLDFARLEMVRLAKITKRMQILGVDQSGCENEAQPEGNNTSLDDADADMISLPQVSEEDIDPDVRKRLSAFDEDALQALPSQPAFNGAIPMAIFDNAMQQFNNDSDLALRFFDMFTEFSAIPSGPRLLQHIVDHLATTASSSTPHILCAFRLPLVGMHVYSNEFPAALRQSLKSANAGIEVSKPAVTRSETLRHLLLQILPYLQTDGLDPSLRLVLMSKFVQWSGELMGECGDLSMLDKLASGLIERNLMQVATEVATRAIESTQHKAHLLLLRNELQTRMNDAQEVQSQTAEAQGQLVSVS